MIYKDATERHLRDLEKQLREANQHLYSLKREVERLRKSIEEHECGRGVKIKGAYGA